MDNQSFSWGTVSAMASAAAAASAPTEDTSMDDLCREFKGGGVVGRGGSFKGNERSERSELMPHSDVVRENRSCNNCLSVNGAVTQHLTPRALRRCRSASPAPVKNQLLTPEQQALIKKSWQKVSRSSLGRVIYDHMIAKCPDSAIAFSDDVGGIGRHERYFIDLIQGSVENVADLENALRPWLETIGEGHKGFAIKNQHWDAFGEALTTAISAWIGPGRAHRETVRAWRLLFSFIADRLGSKSLQRVGASCWTTPRIQLLTLMEQGPNTPP